MTKNSYLMRSTGDSVDEIRWRLNSVISGVKLNSKSLPAGVLERLEKAREELKAASEGLLKAYREEEASHD